MSHPIYKSSLNLDYSQPFTGTFGFITKAPRQSTFSNSDGLINCLRQPGLICNEPPKSKRENSEPLFELLPPGLLQSFRNKVYWAAGRRTGALFFARHLDSFTMTCNSQSLPGLAKNAAPRRRRQLIKPPGR